MTLLGLAVAMLPVVQARAETIAALSADYQQDNNGHPDTAGSGQWFYARSVTPNPNDTGYNFTLLAWDPIQGGYDKGTDGQWIAPLTTNADGTDLHMFPSGNGAGDHDYDVVRWISGVTGPVEIVGNFRKADWSLGYDGVEMWIYVDGEQSFHQSIDGNDAIGADFCLTRSVLPGSEVDFILGDCYNPFYDSTLFHVSISSVPEPTALILLASGLSCLLLITLCRRIRSRSSKG